MNPDARSSTAGNGADARWARRSLGEPRTRGEFVHEALLYEGEDDFVRQTLPFVRDAVNSNEPMLVMVPARHIDMLSAALDPSADSLYFEDMWEVGDNPALIIPVWREFVATHAQSGRPVRGIGEPVWPGRDGPELVECDLHERLLNLAFDQSTDFWLLCPYDTHSLAKTVVTDVHASHPLICHNGNHARSTAFRRVDLATALDGSLPEAPEGRIERTFGPDDLEAVAALVISTAERADLGPHDTASLTAVADYLCTASVRYGGGSARLRLWLEVDRLICEVIDSGHITNALVGREGPGAPGALQRGLWHVQRLCDLAQVRSSAKGTTVRVHMRIGR